MDLAEDHPDALDTLRSGVDWVRWCASRFEEAGLGFHHGNGDAVDEALALVLHVLSLEPGVPDSLLAGHLTRSERARCLELAERRISTRKPLAYLTGVARFAGLTFQVDERVLVPRSPIAELIEHGFQPWVEPAAVGRVLDLCTGSGCIGIACAYALPQAEVDLSDIDEDALEVARANVLRHGLGSRVQVRRSDLMADLPEGRSYDLIVSNPPYVDADEVAALSPEHRAEPALGLASGEDGLDHCRRILVEALDRLTGDGVLVVEVGASEAAMEAAYPELPLVWPEFARGGSGVFVIAAEDLRAHEAIVRERAAS